MNILMMTNTYKPITGGLERSVEIFTNEMRKRGHEVVIVAPEHKKSPEKEKGVIRVPAIQHFNGTDFSVQLPIPLVLSRQLKRFKPDIVHSHHPFLIGDTALRVSAQYEIPIVFTFHTLYEEYTHYVPIKAKAIKKFVIELSKGYANLCDHVFAPSESIADALKERGVKTPISVNPTGIYIKRFNNNGNGYILKKTLKIPEDAYVIGYAGRLAPEKNIIFLAKAVSVFMKENKETFFLLLGKGSSADKVKAIFRKKKLENRLRMPGILKGEDLNNAYKSMNIFAFASLSETQGLVLTEAMAAGVPVVAIDAPGVREVVRNGWNGCLLDRENIKFFASGLSWVYNLTAREEAILRQNAIDTAERFTVEGSIDKALEIYRKVIAEGYVKRDMEKSIWQDSMRMLKTEWSIASNMARAAKKAVKFKKGIDKITSLIF